MTTEIFNADKTTGDSDDSTLDSDDAKEQDGNTGTSRISPERSSSPLLNNKGNCLLGDMN